MQNLKRDIDVHKQVQQELAHRAMKYQKIIKIFQKKLKNHEDCSSLYMSKAEGSSSMVQMNADQHFLYEKSIDTIGEAKADSLEKELKNLNEY